MYFHDGLSVTFCLLIYNMLKYNKNSMIELPRGQDSILKLVG